ncbi:MAG TPA: efflux RND transporter permease subunit [Bacteroidales bacterium]|nr:efflux RND transporter permease subunit [Bacteroidales bacterium]
MSKRISLVESAMRNRQIVFLVTALMVALGIYALYTMPRQEFPTITIRQGLVIGYYPGATSSQVEQQMTTEVERYLFSYKEVNKKKTYSISKDGLMIIFVELNDHTKNADQFWSKLKHGLNEFKTNLPVGVLALYADNDFGDTSALLISIEGNNISYRQLETYMNKLEDRLRRIESVSKLRHYGLQNEQISIYLEKGKLEKYGISSSTITAGLFTQGLTASSSSVDYSENRIPIHISSVYKTEDDIAGQIIYADPAGNLIRVKDIARVVREYPEPDSYIENNAHKSVLISMEMLEGNNIVHYGKEVDDVLKDFKKELPAGVSIERIADQPKVVKTSVTAFLIELVFAIVSVIAVTMLLLPFRVASVAASSIPVTIFISLGLMYVFGFELNTVTLAALIVVLGMIVDNSIVIVDSYMEKIDQGMSRWAAAISSAKTYFKAIFSATLAISITFFPFLFTLKGTLKDFVLMFPWTVTLTLGISLMIAMLVIPYLEYFFIRTGFKSHHEHKARKFNLLDFIQRNYEKNLLRAFDRPKMTIAMGVLSVLLAVALFFIVPQRLMPVAERDQFAVEIYLPQGSSLHLTETVADSLEHLLKQDKRILSVTSFIGCSSPRFHTTYAPRIPAHNYAQFIVNTVSSTETENLLNEYAGKYGNYFPNAYIRFKQLDYQPIAAPIEVRITGDSISDLKKVSDSLRVQIDAVKGICWVRTDFGEMEPSARVDINTVEANRLGIDKTTVATNLAVRYNGLPVTTLWEDDYPVPVKLRTENNNTDPYLISNEYIHSLIPGVSVPLRQIATVKPDWNEGQIVRRNGLRTLTVMADINRGENVNHIFPEVKAIAEKTALPAGVSLSYGGANENDDEHLPGILSGLAISIFMIFMILVAHFRKISMALLVLLSASLSLLGAFAGVLLVRVEFGITSILGIVSLVGILVRNGIIMLDYAEELREKHGLGVKEAAIEAGKRRMRPIFLTSAAASVGVLSMIISANPLWSPMGAVICLGTLTSMVLLVMILPVTYWMVYKNEDKAGTKNPFTASSLKPVVTVAVLALMLFAGNRNLSAQQAITLEDSRKLALENNVLVKNANLELLTSRQVKKEAFTGFFPKVSATGMMFRFNDPLLNLDIPGGNLPVYDGNPANLMTATQFAYFPGISLSLIDKGTVGAVTAVQPVFAGGRIINGNRLAGVGISVNEQKLNLSEKEVLLKTEEQYWQIVSLTEKRRTLDAAEQLIDSLYNEASDAWKAGLINRNDVLKVNLKKSELKASRLKLENGINLATMAFCQFLGIPSDSSITLADSILVTITPAEVYADGEMAVKNRDEYRLLQESVTAEKLKTRLKVGEYLPQAGVGVGAMYYDIPSEGTTNTMVFGTVNVPLSDWWGASHAIKQRKYQEEIAENNMEDKTELLLLQIRKCWNELNEAWNQVDVSGENLKQAEDNLKVNRDNYNAGILNISDMLEAQAILQQARNQVTEARTDYRIKLTAYMQATARE